LFLAYIVSPPLLMRATNRPISQISTVRDSPTDRALFNADRSSAPHSLAPPVDWIHSGRRNRVCTVARSASMAMSGSADSVRLVSQKSLKRQSSDGAGDGENVARTETANQAFNLYPKLHAAV